MLDLLLADVSGGMHSGMPSSFILFIIRKYEIYCWLTWQSWLVLAFESVLSNEFKLLVW